MSDIREISQKRIKSLGISVDLSDILHMKVSDNFYDLDKGNWIYKAAAERITKDPRRQSIDEKKQIEALKLIYPSLNEPEGDKTFDAIHNDNDWGIKWTMKGGQIVDGGTQSYQFNNVVETINNHAPPKSSNVKSVLAVLVNGYFWTKLRSQYKGTKIIGKYEWITPKGIKMSMPQPKQFSLIDLLKNHAQNKKCVIFSDNNMPQKAFYASYIKGVYDE